MAGPPVARSRGASAKREHFGRKTRRRGSETCELNSTLLLAELEVPESTILEFPESPVLKEISKLSFCL